MEARLFLVFESPPDSPTWPEFVIFWNQEQGIPITIPPIPNSDKLISINEEAMDWLYKVLNDEVTWKGWSDYLIHNYACADISIGVCTQLAL